MTNTQKQAIVQSLESMSHEETDQLVQFIQELLYNPRNEWDYMRKKAVGMQQIKAALLPFQSA